MTSVFQVGQPTALKITTDTIRPSGIAADHDGNVYVIAQGTLYVYAPRLAYLIRTVAGPTENVRYSTIAVDAQNDVYFLTPNGIAEYSEGAATLVRTLPVNSNAFAVDAASNLYVGVYVSGSSGTNGAIQVYGPTGPYPTLTIPLAYYPDVLAVDSMGHIYVTVCPRGTGDIEVYSPTGVLIRSKPGCAFFLALDRNDYLYAGYSGPDRNVDGAIAAYKPYSFDTSRTINQGVHRIRAMIVSPDGDLYVANGRGGTNTGNVVMYRRGEGVPAWTAAGGGRNGITYPTGLAVWQP